MRFICKLLLAMPLCVAMALSAIAKEGNSTPVGNQVDEFSLQDFRGKSHSLSELKDSKVVVVAFLGVECPLSKLYGPRLAELAAEYESKGVSFLGVDSRPGIDEAPRPAKLR